MVHTYLPKNYVEMGNSSSASILFPSCRSNHHFSGVRDGRDVDEDLRLAGVTAERSWYLIVKELGLVNKPSRESQKMVTIWIYLLSSNIHNYAASCIVQYSATCTSTPRRDLYTGCREE